MLLTLDACHEYPGYFDIPSRCHLRIYLPEQGDNIPPVVIATQYQDNPGTSVTNMAEGVASGVWKSLGRPRGMIWLENYEPLPEGAGTEHHSISLANSEFDRVEFDISPGAELTDPRWKAVSREEVEALVGQPVASVQQPYAPCPQAA